MAYCYPYTYTNLKQDLWKLTNQDPKKDPNVQCDILCRTRAGNSCFMLTITDQEVPAEQKLGMLISARVHPGETNSSWMMRGLLRYLCDPNLPHVKALRRQFVFKIIPMLNPDGVIDVLYCDLHGHSRQSNVFMYGCDSSYQERAEDDTRDLAPDPKQFLMERLLPFLYSQQIPSKFSFKNCRFSVHASKEATGRVVFWRQFGVLNSFTLECSMAGASMSGKMENFNIVDLESTGRDIAQNLLKFKEITETEE
ncbi:Cytosolic carboxypeptidase 2 [Cichlidogyrus casuarinus]|uniref:Cytosolic carboxypeptidase 2 n=1 Tax=Cichlidogyrus casuarinus TaxID=1844966 RepID=A0ABD2QGY4_9PLAT